MLLAVTVIEFDKSCPCALYQLIRTQFYLPLSQNELVLRSPWLPSLFCFSVCLSTLTNYGTPLHLAQSWHEQPLCKVTTVALSPKGFLILGYPLLSHTHTHTHCLVCLFIFAFSSLSGCFTSFLVLTSVSITFFVSGNVWLFAGNMNLGCLIACVLLCVCACISVCPCLGAGCVMLKIAPWAIATERSSVQLEADS